MANIIHFGGGGGSGMVAQATAPTNTKLLWIDTSNGGVIKYYNGTEWVTTSAAFS